jgi:hypothetical protein
MVNGTNNLPESRVVKIWQQQPLGESNLTTEEGEPIRVIYPGRLSDDQGADLLDAVIVTRQGLVKGDIEVHVKSSYWQAHRHQRDPRYNRVILHVVMWRDTTEVATSLQNGGEIPILALNKYIQNAASRWLNVQDSPSPLNLPCHQAKEHMPTKAIAGFLDCAGEERFLAKADKFQTDLTQIEASQSLYEGIMVALGYSRNKRPFLELARRVPLQTLESLSKSKIVGEECLDQQQALLLGTAGLLPSQRPNWHRQNKIDSQWIEKLEQLWISAHHTEAMSENDWRLFKVRPNNFPVRRMVAMSYLTLRYKEKGIFAEVVKKISEMAVKKRLYRLEEVLLITAEGYWANHYDFGSASRLRLPTLLGRSRAVDIVVNVLLPFAFAWGKLSAQQELPRKAFALYCQYPKLAINTVEKHMLKQFGLSGSLVSSARRQQGLLHIYKELCSQGKCRSCFLAEQALS